MGGARTDPPTCMARLAPNHQGQPTQAVVSPADFVLSFSYYYCYYYFFQHELSVFKVF